LGVVAFAVVGGESGSGLRICGDADGAKGATSPLASADDAYGGGGLISRLKRLSLKYRIFLHRTGRMPS
jgi:hypothetical protein